MARRGMRSDWGSVQEVERGRRYRIRWWAETPEGYRRCSETVRGTRRDAHDRLAALRLEHGRDTPCPTVGEAWCTWARPALERRLGAGEIAPGTLGHYDMAWANQVSPAFSGVPADAVTPAMVQSWYDGMTRSQAEMARIVLRAVFDECELRGTCLANVARRRYRMPPAGSRRDAGVWTLGELRALWEASRGTYMEPWLVLSAFGGPRVGESLGVRTAEVELALPGGTPVAVVPIVRQAGRLGEVTDRLKTAQSAHAAVVPGPLGARLHALCAASDDEWVLQGPREAPMGREAVRDRFDRLVRSAGVPRHPLRNLRNSWETFTHWTLCVDPEKIERMMGHVGHSVTERHYDRPEADMLAAAVAEAYRAHPYADGWGVTWDELGRNRNSHTS